MEMVDFTKMRKGQRTRGTAYIVVCPTCGRKGELRVGEKERDGIVRHCWITHKMEVVGGMFATITDSCRLSHDVAIEHGWWFKRGNAKRGEPAERGHGLRA